MQCIVINHYVRMLFIDYSSAFNTIVPSELITKPGNLRLNTSLCNSTGSLDFLMGRPQVVRVGNNTSATLTLNTGVPPGCVLSPLLYSLFTHDCLGMNDSNTIKFSYDTTVVGLITDSNETAYREEVRSVAVWCQDINLSLNVSKTKDLFVDYRRKRGETPSTGLWSTHTRTVVKRARQHLIPLRRRKRLGIGPRILKMLYSCTIEGILTDCITACYGKCTAFDRKELQRVVQTAQYITGVEDLYIRRCQLSYQQAPRQLLLPSHKTAK
ncbi:uncharacterized protein ACWYII_046268 [Salvelinus alpinus]